MLHLTVYKAHIVLFISALRFDGTTLRKFQWLSNFRLHGQPNVGSASMDFSNLKHFMPLMCSIDMDVQDVGETDEYFRFLGWIDIIVFIRSSITAICLLLRNSLEEVWTCFKCEKEKGGQYKMKMSPPWLGLEPTFFLFKVYSNCPF